MVSRLWLDAFRAQLQKQSLPSWYVRRLTQELSDHIADVEERDLMDVNDRLGTQQLGEPGVVGQAAGDEFRSRSFLRRHPNMKLMAIPSAAAGLLVLASVLTTASAVLAGDYLVNVVVKGPQGNVVASPKFVLQPGKDGMLSFQDGTIEYVLAVQAGADAKDATHTVDLRVSSVGAAGAKTAIAAPHMIVPTDKPCQASCNGYEFQVEVGSVAADR